jgi:hypothetical protein
VAPLEEVCFQPEAGSAICVQRFDDSLNSAIRTTYRISLRSSSLLMPRYPSTRVVYLIVTGDQSARSATKSRQTVTPSRGGVDLATERKTHAVCRSRVLLCEDSNVAKRRPTSTHAKDQRDTEKLYAWCGEGTIMILPQVHLRKPCYDFSFL